MAHKMLVDIDRCIGCWTCAMGCKVGNHLEDDEYRVEVETHGSGQGIDRPEGVYPDLRMWWQPVYLPSCTFCAERIDAGDGQVQACVAACPAGARVFGELDDIRAEAEAAGGYQLLPEEDTNPSVWYIPFNLNK